jgi:hypothetical protein
MGEETARVHDVIGENVDRLCTLELRPRGYSHGVIHPLYRAARQKIGAPLALTAAQRLQAVVQSGDVVLLATGAGHPLFLPWGETDGPLGATALARMLSEGLGAVPIILTEVEHVANVEATAIATGLGIRPLSQVSNVPYTTTVLPIPVESGEARQQAQVLFDDLQPKAVITIEKLGPNAAGIIHSATGIAFDTHNARAEHLVYLAQERGILTIGVGDNGNELGFGLIQEAVWEHKPFGRKCQCPCEQGMATVVPTDVLVVAGTSNWGAYAIEACLAALIERPELMRSSHVERFMLEENVRTGGVDGSTGRQILQVDGTSMEIQLALNELFRGIVRHGLETPHQRAF